MTDKQIIIHGVDVSGCYFYDSDGMCCTSRVLESHCEDCRKCMYKLDQQLKRKEQECEELKEDLRKSFEEKDILHLIIDRLLEASGYDTNTASAEDFEDVYEHMRYEQQQLDQLKDELEDYIIEVEEDKKIIDQLKAENDLYKNAHKTEQDRRRSYEQVLTEIKEIAEDADRKLFATISDDYTEGYCWLGRLILQKISEVIDEN